MELLVLSGLAYIGYELSKDNKTTRTTVKPTAVLQRQDKYPIENDNIPNHNNMIPYFTSAKAQNTNDTYKQRSLENFTGTDNIRFQNKKECENLFQPQANLSNINGATLSLDDRNRKDRYTNTITGLMNNVSPIEKQYVGPGLNVGPDVASKGGYHDLYRILPDNVNSYKKNSFAGRVLSGKNMTTERDSAPVLQDNKKPERYYTMKEVPLSQGRSQTSAPSSRSTTVLQDTMRESCTPGLGIAGPANMAESMQSSVQYNTRTHDRTECYIPGGPSMAGHGAGAYTTTSTIISEGQREQCKDNSVNVQQQGAGMGVYYTDSAGVTQRGDSNKYNGHIHNSGTLAGQNSTGYVAAPTYREGTSAMYHGAPCQGNAAHGNRQYNANATMRGNTQTNYSGPAGGAHKGNMNHGAANNACAYYQREEMGREYTPGGGNMNLRANAQDILPHMIVKEDCNQMTHIAPIKGPNAVTFSNQQGHTEYVPKVPVQNTRLDLNIAQSQLASNQIAQNINK